MKSFAFAAAISAVNAISDIEFKYMNFCAMFNR